MERFGFPGDVKTDTKQKCVLNYSEAGVEKKRRESGK